MSEKAIAPAASKGTRLTATIAQPALISRGGTSAEALVAGARPATETPAGLATIGQESRAARLVPQPSPSLGEFVSRGAADILNALKNSHTSVIPVNPDLSHQNMMVNAPAGMVVAPPSGQSEATRMAISLLKEEAVNGVVSSRLSISQYVNIQLQQAGEKGINANALNAVLANVEKVISDPTIQDAKTILSTINDLRRELVLSKESLGIRAEVVERVIRATHEFSFISGLKRLIESTGTSQGTMYLHASLLVAGGKINEDALNVLKALAVNKVIKERSFMIVVSAEQKTNKELMERLADLQGQGVRWIPAEGKEALENTPGMYTIAVSESKSGYNFASGILGDTSGHASVVVSADRIIKDLIENRQGYFVLYMTYQAHFTPDEAKKGTFIGNEASFLSNSKDFNFRNLIQTYRSLIRIISPWEVLLNLYRQIQLAVNASA